MSEAPDWVARMLQALESRGLSGSKCPVCSRGDFDVNSQVVIMPYADDPESEPDTAGYYAEFTCNNCGYSRLHDLAVLDVE